MSDRGQWAAVATSAQWAAAAASAQWATSVARDSRTTVTRIWPG